MFTGLIADRGSLSALERDEEGVTLRIVTPLANQLQTGDSIAVNGVCLTATHVGTKEFATHAMAETLRRSSLGSLAPGARVNLELALRAADRLGGHIVQGHIDGIGTITQIRPEGSSRVLRIALADPLALRYLVEKGSIAIDGVSLTISALCESEGDGQGDDGDQGERGDECRSGVGSGVEGHRGVEGRGGAEGRGEVEGRGGGECRSGVERHGGIERHGGGERHSWGERGFEVSLIPETLQRTSLGEASVGDRVNLEVDVLAKHLERLLEARA